MSPAKTAVVIGAGPAGLTAALTIQQEGYARVVVFERRPAFTRGNVVNLHPESLHVFERLGVRASFVERASRIADHQSQVYAWDVELYRFSEPGHPVAVDPLQPFDVDDVADGFRNETLYSIALADLQTFLAEVARTRGIEVISPAAARVVPAPSGVHSVRVEGPDGVFTVDSPDLIVVADGARGLGAEVTGIDRIRPHGLRDGECWVFGNCRCEPRGGFSNLLFEFRGDDPDDVTISNSIFLPRTGEVNIAVTVRPEISSDEAGRLIATQCQKILAISGVEPGAGGVVWHTPRAVRITPTSAQRVHLGRNVVVAGDAAGSNSPVAALGGTLSTSAYPYAIRELVRDLEQRDAEFAMATYARRVRAYVARWHQRVAEIRRTIETELRPTPARSGTGNP